MTPPPSDDADVTRTTTGPARQRAGSGSGSGPSPSIGAESGWLSSSGSIDHGRFTPGDILDGRYRITGLLGRGGMGEVYRADDLRLGQAVAIKLLPAALTRDPRRLAQFHNEVRTARQVSHPAVCRVHDIGEVDGQLFITMEFVDGEDLAASLKRVGRFPEDRALDLARQISAGLAAAHDRGIIHRDLKPANIMLDKNGKVRLMDFGLAAAGVADDVRAGTPAYMAPEQLDGTGVSVKSDIYALGLVLYELFTGKRAFTAKSLDELLQQHANRSITPPGAIVKGLDPAIEAALMRCLEPSPALRPSSALAVSAALPGGDPLSAALAAGETPSPEMVAAAGEDSAALPMPVGVALVAASIVMLILSAWLCDRTTLIHRVRMEYAPSTLVDKARDLEKQLGYTGAYDRASGISRRDEVIGWLQQSHRDAQLANGGAPLSLASFWYRSSPTLLIPDGNEVTNSDPPSFQAGMTSISLDAGGRLLLFTHAPVTADITGAPEGTVPWDTLFAAAGLDRARFTETTPQGAPRVYGDTRAAWTGTIPGMDDVPVRIEAAAFHGRPVLFSILGPWNQSSAAAAREGASVVSLIATVIVVPGMILAAALVARANVRAGRGDRRGAIRLASAVVVVSACGWMLAAHHVRDPNVEINRFFRAIALAMFDAGTVWLFYLAAEPQVRKVWPHILITWSRLIGGRVRDSLIGRDVVVGVAGGLVMTVVSYFFYLMLGWVGLNAFMLRGQGIETLASGALLTGLFFGCVSNALQNSMLGVVGLALVKMAVKREWVTFLVATAIFTPLAARGQFQSGVVWLDLLFGAILVATILGVQFRFGLFASIVAFTTHFWTFGIPLTLDTEQIYFSAGFFSLAIIAVLSVAGLAMMSGARVQSVRR